MGFKETKQLFRMFIEMHYPEMLEGHVPEQVWERFEKNARRGYLTKTLCRSVGVLNTNQKVRRHWQEVYRELTND